MNLLPCCLAACMAGAGLGALSWGSTEALWLLLGAALYAWLGWRR